MGFFFKTYCQLKVLTNIVLTWHKSHTESLHSITHKLNSIMSTQTEVAQGLTTLTTQVAKIGDESKTTLQKVIDLEAALGNQQNVSPELQAAFDALKTQVQTVDDLIPDVTPTPPVEG